jgi:branched-chain amino acid transport system permease protein
VHTTRFKVAAFVLGAAFTGWAGGLQGLVNGSVLPDQTSIFDPYRSLEVILICLIGGVGTIWGPVIGMFVLYAVQEALIGVFGSGDWRPVFFGAFVVLLILFLPRGLQQFTTAGQRLSWRALWRNLTAHRI